MTALKRETILAACAAGPLQEIRLDGADAPRELVLWPRGRILVDGHEPFVVDEVGAKQAIAEFNAAHRDRVIDRDHATQLTRFREGDGAAPAVGWITGLKFDRRGLVAEVNWTASGRRAVASRAYRHVSPVAEIAHVGGARRCIGIKGAAVTNDPATLRVETIAASRAAAGQKFSAAGLPVYRAFDDGRPTDELVSVTISEAGLAEGADGDEVLEALANSRIRKRVAAQLAKTMDMSVDDVLVQIEDVLLTVDPATQSLRRPVRGTPSDHPFLCEMDRVARAEGVSLLVARKRVMAKRPTLYASFLRQDYWADGRPVAKGGEEAQEWQRSQDERGRVKQSVAGVPKEPVPSPARGSGDASSVAERQKPFLDEIDRVKRAEGISYSEARSAVKRDRPELFSAFMAAGGA